MVRTFNLGIGMVVITSREHVASVQDEFSIAGEKYFQIGEVIAGTGEVKIV
jgi:phosphoribosylaminoimidazole (AIR) synthetase